jgi:hypothetical protein
MDKETVQRYRNVFTVNDGLFVLAHMLSELGFFDDIDEKDVALKLYGARLLKIIGGGDVQRNAFDAFIKNMAAQVPAEIRKIETMDDMMGEEKRK